MKNSIRYNFLVSIIIYLIFEKVFYALSSLNSIMLFEFNFSSNFYFIGFLLAAILSAVVAFSLYRYFIHNKQLDLRKVIEAIIFLCVALLLYFIINKYHSQISESTLDKEIFEKQLEFYAFPDLVFMILSVVLFFAFILILVNQKRIK